MTFLEIAKKVLEDKEIKIPLTTKEIWQQVVKNGYTKEKNRQSKSSN